MLKLYKYSIIQLLSSVYPEYEWLPWKFNKAPNKYWENVETHKKFVEWAGKELGIKDLSDWYKVTTKVTVFFSS